MPPEDVSHQAPRAAGKRRRRSSRLRGILTIIVGVMTLAIVAGALVAIFRFHYYTVTSNSMSPTLMGNPELRDRVLCWLGSFPGREPERWEIVIFHTPNKENLELLEKGEKLSLRHDMTIKRVVALGGETLALRDGDVWTRKSENQPFRRRTKSADMQETLWIPVYEASFSSVSESEFTHYWRARGDGARVAGDELLVPPGAEFRFTPWMRTGMLGREMRVLDGVPDRYLLPQSLTYLCAECGAQFDSWFAGGQVQERCPSCDTTAYEENVLVYSHDSGLAVVGPDAAGGLPPGSANRVRVYPYHIVGDLRLAMEVKLPYSESGLVLKLEKNGAVDTVELSAAGVAFNNQPLSGHPGVATEKWVAVEFSRVDGELRLVIDKASVPLPRGGASVGEMLGAEHESVSSGVAFASTFAGVAVRRVSVGRDIHYFSGVGNPLMPQFNAMTMESETVVPENAFFTLGDNADVSLDSRGWGALPYSLLAGTAVWWDSGEHLPGARFGESAPKRGRH